MTTIGRRSGEPRRIEIWFHNLGGRIYISGLPGRRGWYPNVVAHPEFVFHLKETDQADIRARAHPITDPARRRPVLTGILAGLGREGELQDWVDRSPPYRGEAAGGRRRGVAPAPPGRIPDHWERRAGPSTAH